MKEIMIKVNGMVCNGCENRVRSVLKTLEGVEKVVADHISGTVSITSKYEVEANKIKEKIEDLGFEVKES